MKTIIVLSILLLSACAPSAEAIQQAIAETQVAWTPVPTQTAYPTHTAQPTIVITQVVTKVVTATFTATPLFTPTITDTPAPTSTKIPTVSPLKRSRGNGFYLINVDIAPGVWRSDGQGSDCYWAVTSSNGDIIDNHFGQAGGTAFLPSSGFQVEFNGCGNWTFIE